MTEVPPNINFPYVFAAAACAPMVQDYSEEILIVRNVKN